MSDSLLKAALRTASTLLVLMYFAPPSAGAQTTAGQDVQSPTKVGVYRDRSSDPLPMRAARGGTANLSEVPARINALQGRASPPVREWIRMEGRRQALGDLSASAIQEAARERFGNDLSTVEIDQLTQLVMAEVAQQEGQDLRDQLAHMQVRTHQKQAERTAAQNMHKDHADEASTESAEFGAIRSDNRVELAAYVARASDGRTSLSDLSEMDQTRLQMAMERRQKVLEALSNLMKKESDTADSIIGNLK